MGRWLYLNRKICKRHIGRIIMLCLVFVLVGLFLLHLSVILSTFKVYTTPYKTLYYDRELIACAPVDYTNMEINISDTTDELAQIDGIRTYSKLGLIVDARYRGVNIEIIVMEEEFWQGYSELKHGTGYSSSGLSGDGSLQALLVDPFGLVKEDAPELSYGENALSLEITARVKAPYLFPYLQFYGTGTIIDFFTTDKTCFVLKKSEDVLKLLDSYKIPVTSLYTRFFYLDFLDNDQDTLEKVNEVLNKNEYMTHNMKDDDMLSLRTMQEGSPDAIVFILYMVFVILFLALVFLAIFYSFSADELSMLRLVGMKGTTAARLAFSASLTPLILSFIIDIILYICFSGTGKLPLSSMSTGFAGKYFYSLPVYLLLLAAFAAIFVLLSLLTLRLMYGKRSVLVLVKEMNV